MKKLALFMLIVFAQNAAFSEDYGIFENDWNKMSANESVTVSYSVKKPMPDSDKEELRKLVRRYDRIKEMDSVQAIKNIDTKWGIENSIDEILKKYRLCSPLNFLSPIDRPRLIRKALSEPVQCRESAQVLIRSLSFKHLDSKYPKWTDAFTGDKTHYCAMKADVDWQRAPSQVDGASFSIFFYDSDGVEVGRELFVTISRDDSAKKITFSSGRPYGEPVRFKIKK